MEAFLHVYSSHFLSLQLNPKCYPLSSCNGFACPSLSTRSWRVNASRRHASLTWVVGQTRSPALIHITALSNGDGRDLGHYEDEWYAMDASQLKALLWQASKRWVLPVAVGAFVGSVIARQTFVSVATFSFLMFMVAHKVLQSQGVHLKSVSDVFSRHFLLTLLNTSKLMTSRLFFYLPVALKACSVCLRRIGMYIYLLLTSTLAHLQGFRSKQRGNIHTVTNSGFESQPNSTDSIMHDINACIQKVEGMIQTDKGLTRWKRLRDNLTLLKAMVATLPLKGEEQFSNDAPMTLGSTVKGSMKSQRRNRKPPDIDKVQTNVIDNLTVHESKEDVMKAKLDVVEKIEDDFSPHAPHLVGKDALNSMATLASNGFALDQERGLFSTELSSNGSLTSPTEPLDAVAALRIGECNSGSGSLSNAPQPKYVDYWTHDDQSGSTLPSGSSEQKNKGYNFSSAHQRNGSVMAGDQITLGEHDFKAPSPYEDRKNFWIEEPQLPGLIGDSDQAKVSSTSLNSGNLAEQKIDGHEEGHEPVGSKSNSHDYSMTLQSEPASLSRENTVSSNDEIGFQKHDSSKDESEETGHNTKCGFIKEQNSTQQMINGSNRTNQAVEPNIASLGSTKELAFMRENPDMHALTGFSRRINEEEFQRLMAEGEIAFRNGKAGLLGKIEVGEAETMLYKAADLFASAAAMDSSSVEALGFWGNTLLVHGELKLMLSRELRHMISIPDVISSYQIRRSRMNETRDKSNRAVLQQTFQAVCEESEELLIQAGRKYRMVLSISNSEIRALYNWGLALCFRAQLIAEEGGQNACEAADKVYLAAIDKFEAIMGISRRYAPGAMLNWGLTLRDRSRLRPMNSAERIDLLQQAKQLFQDALRLQPDDAQIRSALTTCSVELKELRGRKELQSKRSTRSFFGNW